MFKNALFGAKLLQAAWRKYGESAFVWVVLETCLPAECVEREQVFIDICRSADKRFGFNICPKAGNCLGVKHSAETRAKRSAISKKMWETRNRVVSPEMRARIAATLTGRPGHKPSAETVAKIAAKNRGRKHTVEAKAKMSAARKGICPTPEQRAKQSESMKRVWASGNYHRTFVEKTHCPHGHQYTPENTYIGSKNEKKCRTCHRIESSARYVPRPRIPKSHCRRGHEFTPEAAIVHGDGERRCRICVRMWDRERGQRRRTAKH